MKDPDRPWQAERLVEPDLARILIRRLSVPSGPIRRQRGVRRRDEDDGLSAVIDWGDVHLGDPAGDLMIAFSFFPAGSREEMIEAYGQTDTDTWRLARIRALHHTVAILIWAHDRGDRALLDEGLPGLDHIGLEAGP